jgi:hypothetical protein
MPQKTTFKKTKLVESLKMLSVGEFKSLGKWLQSPWCNANKTLLSFYTFLKQYFPDFESVQLERENIFKKLYPDKKYNDKWFRNLMAELNKQIESFLIHQRLDQEEDLKKIILAKEYEQRHQTGRLFKLAEQFNSQLEGNPNKSREDYFYGCYLNDLLYSLPEVSNQVKETGHQLNKADAYLGHFFVLEKWRYLAEFKERERLTKEKYDQLIDVNMLKEIGKDVSIPAIDLYEAKLNTGENISEDQFKKLKEDYFHQFDKLSFRDQQIFYFYLLNILIGMCISGKSHLFEMLFDLYQVGIENKLLLHHNRLSDKTYANIVTLGNSLQKFETIDSFLNTYTPFLKKEEQLDGSTWGKAHWRFKKKEFEQAINLLKFHKFSTPTFEIQGRFLLLQSYFESLRKDKSYLFLFFDYSRAYNKFIVRNKILSASRKKAYQTFIKYTCKIADLIITKEKKKAVFLKLAQDIDKESILQGKRWLKKVLELLISNLK